MKKILILTGILTILIGQCLQAMETNPLVEAAIFNNWQLAEKLICVHRYTPNTPESPLPIISFIKHKNIRAIEKLITNYGANIDLSDPQLGTPMTFAIRMKHFEIFALLHRLGGDIFAKDCKGDTPYNLSQFNSKAALLNEKIERGETVRISELNLPIILQHSISQEDLFVFQPKKKPEIARRRILPRKLAPLELKTHKSSSGQDSNLTDQKQSSQTHLSVLKSMAKSISCPELESHAQELNSRLQKLEILPDGTAYPTMVLAMSEDGTVIRKSTSFEL